MTEEWIEGDPPHVGWWNASRCEDWNAWRWWDGSAWSSCAYPTFGMDAVIDASHQKSIEIPSKPIKFRTKYPEKARVNRVNPVNGEITGEFKKCLSKKIKRIV